MQSRFLFHHEKLHYLRLKELRSTPFGGNHHIVVGLIPEIVAEFSEFFPPRPRP